nr:ribonuclease H [Pimelobacter sp. 30-1]
MEIRAALEAVRTAPGALRIWSDSRYVVDCLTQGWWKAREKNGWKNSKKQPVANRDLWEPLIEATAGREITFSWVKGHSGVQLNEVADRLANFGMLGEPVTAPLDLSRAEAEAKATKRLVVSAKWTARGKACGESYATGASVTNNELGWVHAESLPNQ